MSREALAFVLGRAALDDGFRDRLKTDPKTAAEEMKMILSQDEVTKVKQMDFDALKQFHKSLIERKLAMETFITFILWSR